MAVVCGLWRYPLKSARALAVEALAVEPRGVPGDRRWMVVDGRGAFLTQRQLPLLAAVRAIPAGAGLHLAAPGQEPLAVNAPGGEPRPVTIWGQQIEALQASQSASDWLQRLLGRACHLVHLPPERVRPLAPGFARHPDEGLGFADGFPVLLVGDGTLGGLNRRLAARGVAPVPVNRFRPNLLVGGLAEGAEDGWRRLRVGEVRFRVAKPCERCMVITVDQRSGLRDAAREPLATLRGYRADVRGNVLFGQNLVAESAGMVRLGDPVTPLA